MEQFKLLFWNKLKPQFLLFLLINLLNIYQLSASREDPLSQLSAKALDSLSNLKTEASSHDVVNNKELPVGLENKEAEPTFDQLLKDGVKAYQDEMWYSCANRFENAIKSYHSYKNKLTDCRLECVKDKEEPSNKLSNLSNLTQIAHLTQFAKFIMSADCFRRCTIKHFNTPNLVDKWNHAFEKRHPYKYLQFCYFKVIF